MSKGKKNLGYSSVIFYSFSISFFILSLVNAFFPISNFKITVLSVVAVLLSLQQLFEACEEINSKISELEINAEYQEKLIELIASSDKLPSSQMTEQRAKFTAISRWIFAAAMVVLIVGLTLDFDFQNNVFSNTSTIASFAVIFSTMGYKEQYAARINRFYEDQHRAYQIIITNLRKQIESLDKL